MPYKYFLGAVLLDKTGTGVTTVLTKTDNISDIFRVYPQELIGGRDVTLTEHREAGLRFRLDVRSVYWNSRLSHEHARIVSRIPKGAVVADVFAGIGPFAVPAARHRGCTVHANDLNPESYRFLVENAKLNGVDSLVLAHNLDGREFLEACGRMEPPPSVYIMNLPAISLAFLDAVPTGSVYAHCFTRGHKSHISASSEVGGGSVSTVSAQDDVCARVGAVLFPDLISLYPSAGMLPDGSLAEGPASEVARVAAEVRRRIPSIHVHEVRDVAPGKLMVCVQYIRENVVAPAAPQSPPRKRTQGSSGE
ncbi:hypothetical protein KIPB_008363 [Kipferlia bialata]|uniref:SAM-dependent methyltransferase TRM5/TYW2-type domain-containing protein n=1 Tax=Kipferlia bialata TaxID=797122 RepID=A0A9K3D1E3_9EUKA|nr:hypothetical protein KIPB_008363 [Kipferlia bialata]|eukprot:g8363.t1